MKRTAKQIMPLFSALALLLALLIAFSILPGTASAAEEDVGDAIRSVIADGLRDREVTIDVSEFELTSEECTGYYFGAVNSHPELFYVDTAECSVRVSGGYVTSILPTYDMDFLESDIAAFDSVCASVIDAMPDGTDEEKLLYLHDYIVTHCRYDFSYSMTSAYNCLVEECAVCEGYSRAFQYLCSLAGMNAHLIASEAMEHAWNAVELNGEVYYVDCTWDDPGESAIPVNCEHAYFLLGREDFSATHASDDWVNEFGEEVYTAYIGTEAYRDAWWTDLNRPVQWVGGLMCYAKSSDRSHLFFRSSGSEEETSLTLPDEAAEGGEAFWYVWGGAGYYESSFITVAAQNDSFYFSLPTEVWKLTVDGEFRPVCTLEADESAEGYIYGLRSEGRSLICYLAESPDEEPCDELKVIDDEIIGSSVINDDLSWKLDVRGVLTLMGSGALEGNLPWAHLLTSVKTYEIDPDNENYRVLDDVLYTADGRELVAFAGGNGISSFDVPEGVEFIGESAFSDCRDLTAVGIPASVSGIGVSAFYCCPLRSVSYPGSGAEWDAIAIAPGNDALIDTYNSLSRPGLFWRFAGYSTDRETQTGVWQSFEENPWQWEFFGETGYGWYMEFMLRDRGGTESPVNTAQIDFPDFLEAGEFSGPFCYVYTAAPGTGDISYGGGSIRTTIALPQLSFYSAETAGFDTWLDIWDYSAENDTVYIINTGGTVGSVTTDYGDSAVVSVAPDGSYAAITLTELDGSRIHVSVDGAWADGSEYTDYGMEIGIRDLRPGLFWQPAYLDPEEENYLLSDGEYQRSLYSQPDYVHFGKFFWQDAKGDLQEVDLSELSYAPEYLDIQYTEGGLCAVSVFRPGITEVSCTRGGVAVILNIDLPSLGFYSSPEADIDTWLGEWELTGDNGTIYLINREGSIRSAALDGASAELTVGPGGAYVAVSLKELDRLHLEFTLAGVWDYDEEYEDIGVGLEVRDLRPGLVCRSAYIESDETGETGVWHSEEFMATRKSLTLRLNESCCLEFFWRDENGRLTEVDTSLFSADEDCLVFDERDGRFCILHPTRPGICTIGYEEDSVTVETQLPQLSFYSSPEADADAWLELAIFQHRSNRRSKAMASFDQAVRANAGVVEARLQKREPDLMEIYTGWARHQPAAQRRQPSSVW